MKAKHINNTPSAAQRVLTFGKYKGEKITDICQEDPTYIDWAVGKGLLNLTPAEAKVRDKYYAEARRKTSYTFEDDADMPTGHQVRYSDGTYDRR